MQHADTFLYKWTVRENPHLLGYIYLKKDIIA